MKLDVFDTYVTQNNGRQMHFDVLVPQGGTQQEAEKYAVQWLQSIGVQIGHIRFDKCRFCHSEAAHPDIEQAISIYGYVILQMQGCPSPVPFT